MKQTETKDLPEKSSEDRMHVLGVPISLVNMDSAVSQILGWGDSGPSKTVVVRDVHGVMCAFKNSSLKELHEKADLVVPDGAPLAFVGRLRGYGSRIGRTPGADLMEAICRESAKKGLGHYFYGGKPQIGLRLTERLASRFPGLRILGTFSPPFRTCDAGHDFSPTELEEIDAIMRVAPDFVWVGLSSPKQEYWMMKAAALCPHGVFLGVGAAFDFHSGSIARAPRFLRNNGFEWLYRLVREPLRLWKRYLLLAPEFLFRVTVEEIERLRGH